ncbi:MAG TPA: MbnP family protein [Saprospiraceae bacterium]|nr:MbnP family protein [Saprospiraceae bacterium]
MKYLTFLLLFSALIIGCKKDPLVNDLISIRAKATYDGQPLVFFQPVEYPQGFKIIVKRVDIMIKGFNLFDSIHTIRTPDSVFVLHFTNKDEADAKNGILTSFQVNEGQYNNLNFGIGVDSLINIRNPSNFPSASVLSDYFYYWDGWKSFIFMKIEGSYDADGDGNYEGTFTYHTGKTSLFKIFNFPVNINAKKGVVNELELSFDIKNILAADGDYIDLVLNPTSHKPTDVPTLEKIYSHLSKSVTLK